jgi:hypothetical protein
MTKEKQSNTNCELLRPDQEGNTYCDRPADTVIRWAETDEHQLVCEQCASECLDLADIVDTLKGENK